MKKRDRSGTSPNRTRHVMIYTFLLILFLLYFASRQQRLAVEGEQRAEQEREKIKMEQMQQKQEEETVTAEEGLILEKEDMWSLVLTNESYPVSDDLQISLREVEGTEESVDERIYEPLMRMLQDMREQGMFPVVCSGYRTREKQTELFQEQVQIYMSQGYLEEEAENLAKRDVSVPHAGEHRLGLAVDIYSVNYPILDQGFADTPEGIWLEEHAKEYGFILRYRQGKEEITGINYEPWHFRYVGIKAAMYMEEHNLCLEEFYLEEGLYG